MEKNMIPIKVDFNPLIIKELKELEARYDAEKKEWQVPDYALEEAENRVSKICGDKEEQKCDLRCTFAKDVEGVLQYKGTRYIIFLGKIIANSEGRDSFARIGKEVIFKDGARPHSAGSKKHWCVKIDAGSVAEVYDVPEGLVDDFRKGNGIYNDYKDKIAVSVIRKHYD